MVEVLHKTFNRILYLGLGDIPALKSFFVLRNLSEFGNLKYFFIQFLFLFFADFVVLKILQTTQFHKCFVKKEYLKIFTGFFILLLWFARKFYDWGIHDNSVDITLHILRKLQFTFFKTLVLSNQQTYIELLQISKQYNNKYYANKVQYFVGNSAVRHLQDTAIWLVSIVLFLLLVIRH